MKDLIERKAVSALAKDVTLEGGVKHRCIDATQIYEIPSAQPEKFYTKADYIMALHKEYGCSLTRAEEAHNKALEYLQDEMMIKG